MPDSHGNEYFKILLQQLKSLDDGIKSLQKQIHELKSEITHLKAREDDVKYLANWKEKMDEVISPTQLKELRNEVESLKTHKTKSVAIFATVQFVMAAVVFLIKVGII